MRMLNKFIVCKILKNLIKFFKLCNYGWLIEINFNIEKMLLEF